MKRAQIQYDFTAFTGKVWANSQVDSYNQIQETINQFIDANMPVPEYLINGSHNLFYTFSINH